MRGNTTRVAVVVGVLMLGLQGASGAMYVEDFDAGSGTWNTYAGADYCQWVANGGVGDSGYLQAHTCDTVSALNFFMLMSLRYQLRCLRVSSHRHRY